MPRYKLIIEYEGSLFAGWQKQANAPSVQAAIEEAIWRFSGEEVALFAAGRTDAGVHASGQVGHFDLGKYFPAQTVANAINYHLKPAAIGIICAEEVDEHFHARFSAIKRHYRYRILNRNTMPILDRNQVWHVRKTLDIAAMQQAATFLLGTHDFTSFRATLCQAKSPIKTLEKIDIVPRQEYIDFYLSAPSFLHHMVRNIIGTLVMVGSGKWHPEEVLRALLAKDRSAAGPTAPACGLCLTAVDYPPSFIQNN